MPEAASKHPEIVALVERSRRLGSDPRVTNFGGGNTSAKVELADPITGETRSVLAVKGSGGDLGTLTVGGLALVDLERLRAMERVYEGLDHEDEMVSLLDHARFGPGGAVPSIDTPLHGFLPAAHVDHLHPDALIAFATAAEARDRVADAFGGRLGWLDWQRPGFDLGLRLRDLVGTEPELVGVVLGGHGVISWADDLRGVGSPLAVADRAGRALPRRAWATESARVVAAWLRAGCRTWSGSSARRRSGRWCAVSPPRIGTSSDGSRTPTSCTTSSPPKLHHDSRCSAPRAPTTFSARRCGRCSSTSPPTPRSRSRPHGCASFTPSTGMTTGATTRRTRLRSRRRCAAPIRRSCSFPESACGASAPTRRPPAWPASSTSTRSTSCEVPRRSRRTSRSRTRRSSASSTGRSRSGSCGCGRRRRR